jgi:surfactin synthase thioesterase subunit
MPDSVDPNRWFVCSHIHPESDTRLFLFPYAGGGPSAFGKWLGKLPPNIEGYIAHYPGRGSRSRESAICSLTVLVERLGQAIKPLLDRPYAFFGHSLGAMVAFELARQLREQKLPQPQALFVSACGAPHLDDPHPPIHTSSDSEFIRSLQQLNGIPSEILDYPGAMQLFLPMLRADFEAAETYHYDSSQPPLECPTLAFGGLDDPVVDRERLEGWASHTNSHFRSHYFPGDHFFINTAKEMVIQCIVDEIETLSDAKG